MVKRPRHTVGAISSWLLFAVMGLSVAGCVGDRPNLLLLVVDTLRADHVGAYGGPGLTPAIDSLASAGTMWQSVYAPSPRTTQSVASLMTGMYPQTHGVRVLWGRLTDDNITLAEILSNEGYATGAVVTNHMLGLKSGLNQGFREYDVAGHERDAAATTKKALRWLGRNAKDQPFFLWVHYLDPHMPYAPPDAFKNDLCFTGNVAPELRHGFGRMMGKNSMVLPFGLSLGQLHFANPLSTHAKAQIQCLYTGEVAYVDQEIRRLLSGLRSFDLDCNTLVVLTSDHGEALGEHDLWCDHGNLLHDPEVRIPLVISGPKVPQGNVIDAPTSLVDVFPTVLDLLGLGSLAGPVEGRKILSLPLEEKPLFLETGSCFEPDFFPIRKDNSSNGKFRGVIDGKHKLVWFPSPGDEGAFELYDLHSDPAETVDISTAKPHRVKELRAVLGRWIATEPGRPPGHPGDPRLPGGEKKMDKERLKALGYLQ